MKLIDEYEKKYEEYIGNDKDGYFDLINKPYKISGNVFAYFLRNKINDSVCGKYNLSTINSYIKGSNVEWDMLIVKKTATSKKAENYNIYLPQDVVCAFEFKSSGAIRSNNPKEAVEYLNGEINELKRINKQYGSNIKYGYISLCEIPDNLKKMNEVFNGKCFWIIEGYYGSRNKIGSKEEHDLRLFIDNLLK
jgi:hypothetical protein